MMSGQNKEITSGKKDLKEKSSYRCIYMRKRNIFHNGVLTALEQWGVKELREDEGRSELNHTLPRPRLAQTWEQSLSYGGGLQETSRCWKEENSAWKWWVLWHDIRLHLMNACQSKILSQIKYLRWIQSNHTWMKHIFALRSSVAVWHTCRKVVESSCPCVCFYILLGTKCLHKDRNILIVTKKKKKKTVLTL